MKKILLLGSMLFAMTSLIHSQLVSEGFETGFVDYQNATGNINNFVQNTVIFRSGANSAHDVYSVNSLDTLYQTDVVDLTTTANPQLIFWQICKLEGGYDDGKIYISTDSGLTYIQLPNASYLGTSTGFDSYTSVGHFDEDSYTDWGTSGTPAVSNTWWKKESFDLSAYIGFSKVKVMFVLESDGSVQREGWFIDDITIENVTCPSVTNLSDFGLGSDTVNVTWTSSTSDTLWSYEYGLAGFTPGTGTLVTFSTNDTVGIGSLLSNTGYDVYVRSICRAGDTSGWQGPHNFTTLCSAFIPTYTQDFTTMTGGAIPSCWELAQGILSVSSTLTVPAFSNWNSRNFANVTGGSNSAYLNLYATGREDWLISPTIDLGTGTLPYQVEFDIAFTDYNNTSAPAAGFGPDDKIALVISTDNGATWSDTNILILWDTSTSTPSFSGQFVAYNLTAAGYTGLVRLAIYAESTVFNEDNDVFIDNFAVRLVPTCPRPLNFRTISVFSDSVNLTWDTASSDGPYDLQYGTSGFVLGTGTSITSLNDTGFINGLLPNTTYEVYLRTICTVGDTSFWVGPQRFTTPCSFFTPPYIEDFSTYSFAANPLCWEEGQGLLTVSTALSFGNSNWGDRASFANNGLGNPAAALNIYSTGVDEWLISPSIDLGSGTIPYQVEFDVAITDYFNATAPSAGGFMGSDDKLALVISTDNGVTWSDTNILVQWDTSNMPLFTGEYFAFNLTAAGYTGLVKFGFYGETTISNEDNDAFIDNFGVVQVPTCPRPLALKFDSATRTVASLSWTNGSADSIWLFEYGPVGFTLGTGTAATSTASPGNITGLSPSRCYDVYMRSVCTVGDSSKWIGPARVCTDCAPVVDLCEDFETANAGELPICWEKFISTTGSSTVEVSNFGGNFAPKSLRMNTGNDGSASLFLISPEMTALNAGTHRASFWMNNGFTGDTSIIIGTMTDPTDPASFDPWDTITDITDTYREYRIPFDTYTDTNTRIAFLYAFGGTFNTISIDDFCFERIPNCEKAPSITVLNSGIDSNKISLGWNRDTTWFTDPLKYQEKFIISYGPTGYSPGDGTVIDTVYTATTAAPTVPNNFISVTGLTALTEYCFWVKSICSNGDTGNWSGPHCGTTGCPPGFSLPYSEDFSTYRSGFPLDETPQCWEEATGTLTTIGGLSSMTESNWETDGFANVGFNGAARFNISTFSTREGWLLTPTFDFGSDPNKVRIIEFDVALTDAFSTAIATNGFGDDDTIAFVVSYDKGLTWKKADILMQWDTSNEPSNTGTSVVYEMRNTSGFVKFGFYGLSNVLNEQVDFFVDNFSIRDTTYVGLDEISELTNFKVFPNPNTGIFTILNEGGANKTSVKVVDVQGRLVYDDTYFFNEKGRKVVDIHNLNAGVYVLLLQSEGKLEQHRIIISK